ncbi:MAG: Wzy polymerase domain-containing protein [Neisseria sp.]
MKHWFSENKRSVWTAQMGPLWLSLLMVCVVPFLSIWRTGPLPSFYLEAGSLLFALVLVLFSAPLGCLRVRIPPVSIYFLVLALFWWLQARVMDLTFYGQNDMVVWTFAVLALMAWALRGWVVREGQEQVVTVLAWVLVFGALCQSVVALMQMTGWAETFRGIIAFRGLDKIEGQLGQRNHLAHYLMWGILSAAYLLGQKRIQTILGIGLVLLLTAGLGLVNSRTIFGYVVLVALLLIFWRVRSGKQVNRMVAAFALALVGVVVFQLSMSILIETFGSQQYLSTIERLGHQSQEISPRKIEWSRAWAVFLSAPLFGYGWGGYSLQGFLQGGNADTFSIIPGNVLFTHSHNIVLQLLTEMGLVGTLLIFSGFAAAVWGCLKKPLTPASLLILAMLGVSLTHSLLEYPLWYIYFLTPFALMMSLSPAQNQDYSGSLNTQKWMTFVGSILAVFLVVGIVRLGFVYQDLTRFSAHLKNDTPTRTEDKIKGLQHIANTEPMFRYYALLSLTKFASATDAVIKPWALQAAQEALVYRPFANTYQWGLYQYRTGDKVQAAHWMRMAYYYYPKMMPFYGQRIKESEHLADLYPVLDESCQAFYRMRVDGKSCRARSRLK